MSKLRAVRRMRSRARGIATLATLMLLLLSALLAAAWAQRSALNEIRSAGNQLHAAGALEAAEAGLEWTQAMLNAGHKIDTACQPSTAAEGSNFRGRYLQPADASGRFAPREPGGPGLRQKISCARAATAWTCSCPEHGAPALSIRSDGNVPAFLVEFAAGSRPGSLEVQAVGCSHAARPCLADAADRADASVRLRVTLALLPTLANAPAASLTSIGSIVAGPAALGLHNADALSGGLAAHAGAGIVGSALRLGTAPGASQATAVVSGDPDLASLTPGQFFSRHFGIDPLQWRFQPGVRRLSCRSSCSAELLAMLESNADVARIAVDGDLRVEHGLRIGRRERPVVLVIDGDLLIEGPAQIHGLVHARNMRWDGVAVDGGGLLLGAVTLTGGYAGDAAADLVYDPMLMSRLQRQSGTWVRVPGSWRDD